MSGNKKLVFLLLFRFKLYLCASPLQVFFASVRSGGSSQVYFMTLGRSNLLSW